jgi:hypothetical protein
MAIGDLDFPSLEFAQLPGGIVRLLSWKNQAPLEVYIRRECQ